MNELFDRLSSMSPERLALLALELQSKLAAAERGRTEPIAIIGMGCRFPGAADPRRLLASCSVTASMPSARCPPAGGTSTSTTTRTRRAGQDRHPLGRLPRRHRPLRSPVLRHLAARGAEPRSRSSGCCSRWRGRRSSTPASRPTRCRAPRRACSSASATATTASCSWTATAATSTCTCSTGQRLERRVRRACPTCSACRARRSRSTPPARRRWSPSTSPCQSLRAGELPMALAGGVNVILSPETTMTLSRARMMAPDGRCKTFDAARRRLRARRGLRPGGAQAAEPTPWPTATACSAVIRGSAVNQDGAQQRAHRAQRAVRRRR